LTPGTLARSNDTMATCPRCIDPVLALKSGAWLEDVCGRCQGRFLECDTMLRLAETYLRIGAPMLRELCTHGPRRIQCPGCGQRMTLTLLRGVQIDLCGGCGGAWLDSGELATLTRGDVREVGAVEVVTGAALVDEARAMFGVPAPQPTAPLPPLPRVRFVVCCINCDAELELTKTNYLINQRPWCASCAAPYAGLGGIIADMAGGVLSTVASMLTHSTWAAIAGVSGSSESVGAVDVLRIAPADAEVRFGPFFRPAT